MDSKKDRAFLNSTVSTRALADSNGKIVFTLDIRKDLLISQLKNLLNTTICSFHSFFIRFSMSIYIRLATFVAGRHDSTTEHKSLCTRRRLAL